MTPPKKVPVNILPNGSALCGWCETQEAWRKALAEQCGTIERRLRTMSTWPRYSDDAPWFLEMADELARLRKFGTEGAEANADQASLSL